MCLHRLRPILAFGSLFFIGVEGADAATVPPYVFTLRNPPLLSVYKGNIAVVPDNQLCQKFGPASFDDISTPGIKRHIELSHTFCWSIVYKPIRYAVDQAFHYKHTTGYKKTSKEQMEQTLGVSGGVNWWIFTAKVNAGLKITNSEEQSWSEENVDEGNKTYKGHTIYCTWGLYDTVSAIVTTTGADGKQQIASADFSNISQIYEDDAPDITGSITRDALKAYFLSPVNLIRVPVVELLKQ